MYKADIARYDAMEFLRLGKSGLKLSRVSLGLWHNFGGQANQETCRAVLCRAFDRGVTSFDLANNYGPPPGSAEENFGKVYQSDLFPYRDEMIIATKAGYRMWEGPYGDGGSRKYLTASLDQSLKRMGLDYVDIFYHHRMDKETPLEESMYALADIVRSGKALYVGLSNYDADTLAAACDMLRELKTPCIIHQVYYNMLGRDIENNGVLRTSKEKGAGVVAYSPLAQGLLTGKYNTGIPGDSRAASPSPFLKKEGITDDKISKIINLTNLAAKRGMTTAQLALKWCLRDPGVTSVIVGASSLPQLDENIETAAKAPLDNETLAEIDRIL